MTDESQGIGMRSERDAAVRGLLIDYVRAEPERRARRRRRSRWLAAGIGVALVGVGATAGTIVFAPATLSNFQYVTCLESDQPAALQTTDSASYPDGAGRHSVQDAIDLCGMLWTAGVFEPGHDPLAVHNPPGRIPDDFQVCVMRDHSAAVVPSDEPAICTRLGLAPLDE